MKSETMERAEQWWCLNNSGYLVISCEFPSMEEARSAAARWNRDEHRPNRRVDVIQNGPTAMGSTRVTTIA